MNQQKILEFCLERGFLLDKEVLNLFGDVEDLDSVKLIIEKIRNQTQQKIITKNFFYENKKIIEQFFLTLPEENQKYLEKLKVKLNLSIEISHEVKKFDNEEKEKFLEENNYKKSVEVVSDETTFTKKPEVKDFVINFKNRFSEMRNFLQAHSELDNLVSINKISSNRQKFSIIGMIYSKRITKEKNILLEVEDLTGRIRVLINKNKPDLYEEIENSALDSVLGFKGTGNKEIIFANEVVFPDSILHERKKSPFDESVVFLGDVHFGSKMFLEKSFMKFIDYINGKIPNTPEATKIKYLVFAGDLITGVGNYPDQEGDLEFGDLEEQFLKIAELFGKIRKDVTIIISPGNHDCVRIMEPQPSLDKKYAWPLYDMKNVILTTNPSMVNLGKKDSFSGFNVLVYHGFSYPYYAGNIPKLLVKKAMNFPEEIMKYLLRVRHLAPTHGSTQYFPLEKDGLIIRQIPDIFVSAHTHKSGITSYNNTLIVSTSCWEAMTSYQEKFGNKPDHCKVPMINLKTGAVKILDFEDMEESESKKFMR